MAVYLCIASNGVPPSISKRVQLKVQCESVYCMHTLFTNVLIRLLIYNCVCNNVCAVPPMLSIPNQLEGAYIGQDVTLECRTEAFPTSINYWTTERGDMIISGSSISRRIYFNATGLSRTTGRKMNKSSNKLLIGLALATE